MEISREEALRSLDSIQETNKLTRTTAARSAGPILIGWGIIWVIGFAFTQFLPMKAGLAWMVLDIMGGFLSWRIGSRMAGIKSSHDHRIFFFFLILLGFGGVWAYLLSPFNYAHFGGYIVTLIMFAYVVGGLWFGRFYVFLGIFVTLLVIAGRLYAGHYESLWIGCAGGGSLITSGMYLGKKGRRARA